MTIKPLDVRLAGFNVDKEGLDELHNLLSGVQETLDSNVYFNRHEVLNDLDSALRISSNLTPETISASYARISRDPRSIPELRADSRKDVEASRISNKAIIFTMGHKSIAEHAVFNFDIMGLSRRAVEDVESKRLQSYTEKSQRYITLDGDFVLPSEIKGTPFEQEFLDVIERQNAFYNKYLETITNWHKIQDYSALFASMNYTDKPKKQQGTIEGLGKEDARYALAMATQTQLGLTTSARNLEDLITRLRSSDVEETRELGKSLFEEVNGIAPSVIKYTNPTDYYLKTRDELTNLVAELTETNGSFKPQTPFWSEGDVDLFTKLYRDDAIIAGLLFSNSSMDFGTALAFVDAMNVSDKLKILTTADKYQEVHDPKLREYELGDRIADIVLSSSAYAQLKRHRMDTIIPQSYDVSLGVTIPTSIQQTGLTGEFLDVVSRSEALYNRIQAEGFSKNVAEYCLTNAHRRHVLFDANNRQVHAFCSERENLAAQWDIRKIANDYHNLIQEESPLTTRSLGGKHEFYDIKKQIQSEEQGIGGYNE